MESLERKDASATAVEEPIKSEGLVVPSPATSERSSGAASPPPHCSICLGKLINTCFTDSCLHQFCFNCLLQWSKIKTECPLCKQTFKSIIHNVRSEVDYDQHYVQYASQVSATLDVSADIHYSAPWDRITIRNPFMYRTTMGHHRRYGIQLLNPDAVARREQLPSVPHQVPYEERRRRSSNPIDYRRAVYRQGICAAELPDAFGRFRESNAEYYRRHPAEVDRLVPWLNRELQALLNDNQPHIAYVMTVITEALTRFNIRSPEFNNLVRQYFGIHTDHFVHELSNFARANFDLVGYDQSVIYTPNRGLTNQFVERPVSPPSSTTNSDSSDSDVRVVGHIYDVPRLRFSVGSHIIDAPGPSSISHAFRLHNPYVAPDVLTISSSSESEGECEVVGYVKPRHERTPEIIDLSSSDEERNAASSSREHDQSDPLSTREETLNLPSTSSSSGDHAGINRRTRRCTEDLIKTQMYEYLTSSSESDSEESDSDYNPLRKTRRANHKSSASKKSSKSSSSRKLTNSRKRTKAAATTNSRTSRKHRGKTTVSKRNRSPSYSNSDEGDADNESPVRETSSTRGTKRYLSKSSDAESEYQMPSKKKKKTKKSKSSKRSKRRCSSARRNWSSSDDDCSSRNSTSNDSDSEATSSKNNRRKKKRKSNTSTSRSYTAYSSETHSTNEEDKPCAQSSCSINIRKRLRNLCDSSRLVDYDFSDEAKSPRVSSSEGYEVRKVFLTNKATGSDEERTNSCYLTKENDNDHSLRITTKINCDSSNNVNATSTTNSQAGASDDFGISAPITLASTSALSDSPVEHPASSSSSSPKREHRRSHKKRKESKKRKRSCR